MGHTRLGQLPTARKWKAVVEALSAMGESEVAYGVFGSDVEMLAVKTLEAAKAGLSKALNDQGLRYTFYLLTQIALASREDDWKKHLEGLGIKLHEDASPFGLTSELQRNR